MQSWNPWHGCHKLSPGCQNCYVYRIDARHGRDASQIVKNADFSLPLQKGRGNSFRLKDDGDAVFTCGSSDFFLPEADAWRIDAWQMIKLRIDLRFLIITKRIDRFDVSLPDDWGEGYDNVEIVCTVENQNRADYRLPLFMSLPIRHKSIAAAPLLEPIDLWRFLSPDKIEIVTAAGESGNEARPCHYNWVVGLRDQCRAAGVPFHFMQTGARFVKDGCLYRIPKREQSRQARKSGLDWPKR